MSILDNNQGSGDKRTLVAVVLSVVVITAGFMLQNAFFPAPTPQAAPAAASASAAPVAAAPAAAAASSSAAVPVVAAQASSALTAAKPGQSPAAPAVEAPVSERSYTIATDLLEATFSNKGGDLVSLKLRKHRDKDGGVDLIVPGASGAQGLSVGFGGPGAAPIKDLMNARMLDAKTIEFYRVFMASVPGKAEPVPFTYRKSFAFRDGEYLFGMAVSLENSVNEYLPLDQGGFAYTVAIGPQIGPRLDSVPKANSDFRKFVTWTGGKKREEKPKAGVPFSPKDQPTWVAISGKYFSFIAVPELPSYGTTMSTGPDPVLHQTDALAISRPKIAASKQTDTWYFYFGPKTNAALARYEYAKDNAFGRTGMSLEQVVDGAGILAPLEIALKFLLNLFYKMIPNYGIAIILVTILMKVVMFPLTKKGSVSSSRMAELQPMIKEIQAKFKGNPQKMNQEMAEFYKREGYNPMSGCLPLLIQFPLFIAMYNLFNNHFDLRGASFIAGWISDLSQPEAILSFPTINLVVWQLSAIRVLPVLYLGSQLLYGMFTQTSAPGQSATQMKIMMYGMPIFFFFILYDVPSGLLLYWIATNLLSIVQQVAINDILKKRKATAALAAQAAGPKLAPKRKK